MGVRKRQTLNNATEDAHATCAKGLGLCSQGTNSGHSSCLQMSSVAWGPRQPHRGLSVDAAGKQLMLWGVHYKERWPFFFFFFSFIGNIFVIFLIAQACSKKNFNSIESKNPPTIPLHVAGSPLLVVYHLSFQN